MRTLATILAGTGLMLGAANARAGVSIDIDVHAGPPARVYTPPVYEDRVERVWVPPVTQTVSQNVWHEAVTEDQVTRTWVPDRFEVRDTPGVDRWGHRVIVRQTVLIEAAHWQETHNPVVVKAGYFAPEATEVTVTPGYWQTVTRQVLVRSGPLDDCGPIAVAPPLPPPYRDDRFHDHYDYRGYDHGDHYHR